MGPNIILIRTFFFHMIRVVISFMALLIVNPSSDRKVANFIFVPNSILVILKQSI